MIAFRTTANRLPFWVRAAWIYLYDQIGKSPALDVDWDHDPKEPNKLTAIYVEVASTEDKINPLLYKLTIFIKTGTIQVQGNEYNLFVTKHFQPMKHMVDNLIEKTKIPEETSPVDDETNMTKVKTVFKNTNETKQGAVNSGCTTPSRIPKPITPFKSDHNLTTLIRDEFKNELQLLESNFTESLKKFSESHISVLQHEFSQVHSKLDSSAKLVDRISKSDSAELHEKIQNLQDIISKQNNEIWSLKNKVLTIQNEHHLKTDHFNHLLQTAKSDHLLEIAKLESNIKLQTKSNQDLQEKLQYTSDCMRKQIQQLELNLEHKNEELSLSYEACARLQDDIKSKDSEILSLKLHASRSSNFEEPHSNRDNHNSSNSKPKVLLVGTSNTKDIDTTKLSAKFDTTKVLAYNFEQTKEKIENAKSESYDAIVLHSLSNELRNMQPEPCASKTESLVQLCQNTWSGVKVIISLATPRLDGLNTKAELVNAMIKDRLHNMDSVYLCDNSNLAHRGTPNEKFLQMHDKFHLNKEGTSVLASNIKVSISSALGIQVFQKQRLNRSPKKKGNSKFPVKKIP